MPQPARSGPYDVTPSGALGAAAECGTLAVLDSCRVLRRRLLLGMGQGVIR
jgi:hypothetical protein